MTSKLRFSRKYFAIPYAGLAIIFVVVPLFMLIVYAFMDGDGAFTFENFTRLGDGKVWAVLGRSFLMAFLTTLICLVIAYPTAMILADSRLNRWAVLVMLFIMPMWINSLLRIYAIKLVFEDVMGKGFGLVLLGMVYDFFPFMLMPLYTILSSTDHSYYEAAQDLGANPFRKFVHVILPLSLPGVISGVLMVFMPTVSTFAISEILGDSENSWMFGNLINYNLERGYYNVGSVYSLLMLVLIFATTIVADRLTGGKTAKKGGTVL